MRCNVGVDPVYLTDQFLIAEYREEPMLIGSLRHWGWEIKSSIPVSFNLGIGHMNFLKNKLRYVQRRHQEVKLEMRRRGFYCETLSMDLTNVPERFCNDWQPTIEDSKILRSRLLWKLRNKPEMFWRLNRKKLDFEKLNDVISNIENGELFYV